MSNSNNTNITANAVNLVKWLSGVTTFAVPAYQRNYDWNKIHCETLVNNIIAAGENNQPHFIGSILSTISPDDIRERTLVDGQQRLITLTLLLAALRQSEHSPNESEIRKVLFYDYPNNNTTIRVRPFVHRAQLLDDIVFGRSDKSPDASNGFQDNFDFFTKFITKENAATIWDGVKQLECVDIIIEGKAAQRVFENINSTGKPLNDADLINNYILMPYASGVQDKIETEYWQHIYTNATIEKGEKRVGERLSDFFRYYLSLKLGKKVESKVGDNERNVYAIFKEFSESHNLHDKDTLFSYCEEWKQLSACYNLLLNPSKETDEGIREYLITFNMFGQSANNSAYPFLMAILNDYKQGTLPIVTLLEVLQQVEAYYIRRAVCGVRERTKEEADRMPALYSDLDKDALCETLAQKLFPHTPSDDDVRQSLKTGGKAHVGYILARIDKKKHHETVGIDIDIEHIFPRNPYSNWSDGDQQWCEYDEKAQQEMRSVLDSIGNYTLLEAGLNRHEASNDPFPDKQKVYKTSAFQMTQDLCCVPVWNAAQIKDRTEKLTNLFLETWKTPPVPKNKNDSALIPIRKVPFHGGSKWYPELRYSQAEFRDKSLQVRDIDDVYKIVIEMLWKENRDAVLAANEKVAAYNRPVGKLNRMQENNSKHTKLDDDYGLGGFAPPYKLKAVCDLLSEMKLADQLFVKYAETEK